MTEICAVMNFEGDWLDEFWLQRYVRENANRYGFKVVKSLSGRGGGGGDLLAERNGEFFKIEVEWIWSSYFEHIGDSKYEDVKMLVCCKAGLDVTPEARIKLPKEIVYVEPDDLSKWYHAKTGRYSRPAFDQTITDKKR